MTIRAEDVSAICVGKLLEEDLRIPPYQRPYSWTPATALQLFDDITDTHKDPVRNSGTYVLGAVILHADSNQSRQSGSSTPLNVVDGQQRLLTLRMMLSILDSSDGTDAPRGQDNPISRVRSELHRRISATPSAERRALADFIRDQCHLVRVVTDDVDEAFRVFDSQNYRGKALAPHDLLKAHHLREMRGESSALKAAVVETWESAGDADLDRLFSIFLYRIARWSRGESAPGFTTHDIGMFKGVTPRGSLSPAEQYHVAAQSALPMLSAWGASLPPEDGGPSESAEHRDAQRSRFQIDAPILAGRPFFEMVSFMLDEIDRLRGIAFEPEWEEFASYEQVGGTRPDGTEEPIEFQERAARSRYRYVSELYLAALLYYTNRFGDEELRLARRRLFAWAYSLRVELLRVQFRSIDNLARGQDDAVSAFELLRNGSSGRTLAPLSAPLSERRPDHEVDLLDVLTELGAS